MGKRKRNFKILGIMFIIFSFISVFIIEKVFIEKPFSFDRGMIYISIIVFISLHFFFNIKDIWNFIYNKRFLLGLILFSFFVINGYHGSSIGEYNLLIQPEINEKEYSPFWGISQSIRSDEYLVNTPALLSQAKQSSYSTINKSLMAKDTTVLMFPQLPTKNISVIMQPQLLGFLVLNTEMAYSFYWFFPIFATFFAVFELFMLITKKRRVYSLLGTMLITFSPPMLWWNSYGIVLAGTLATLAFHYFLESKSWGNKLLYSLLLGIAGSMYIATLYPAWMIPYGYFFLGLFIWQIIEYWKTIKPKDLLYLIPAISVMVLVLAPAFLGSSDAIKIMSNTVYPGERNSVGGAASYLFYNYFHSIFFSVRGIENASEFSQFISLYPLPLILGVWQILKNHKLKIKDSLLIILTIIGISISLWNYFPLELLSKISMMYMSTPERSQLIVGFICIFIMIKLLSGYETKKVSNQYKIPITFVICSLFAALGLYIVNRMYPNYLTWYLFIISAIFYIPIFVALVLNVEKYNRLLIFSLLSVSICIGLTVNPLSRGLSVFYEKPLGKKVNEIYKENPNARWLTTDSFIIMQSYILSSGAKVINSTNYRPNFDFWYKLDPNKKFENIYNRYSHVNIMLTKDKTNLSLKHVDLIDVKLNVNDICKFNTDYVASFKNDLSDFNNSNIKLDPIYQEGNGNIYKVSCNERKK
ncbi:MAG: hypothetical protein RSC93_09795 [Erysipelotrichaceae bacterium]